MADKYSRAKYIDDLVSSGEFSYEEAKKYADEYERGAPTKVERPESAAISEPSPADVQAGLKGMKIAREEQDGLSFGEKVALGGAGGAAVAAGSYLLGKRSGIRDRMIGERTRIEPQMDVNQQGPKEPTFAPETPATSKAASLAQQFEAEYGIPLSDVEKHYQVPIKDMQEARLLGGAYKANIAPATPAGVIPSTTYMTTGAPIGVAPPAAMPEPINFEPSDWAKSAPSPASAPAPAPVVEVPVLAATESDVPNTQAAKSSVIESQYDEMKPTYNKGKKNPIGPGAYGWVAGQEGPKAPEVWKNLVGDKNMTYDEFMKTQKPLYEAYLGSYGEPDPFKQAANPGGYRKPTMIPKSIKGAASLGGLATAAGGSLAALGVMQAIKKGKETGDYTDLGQIGLDTIAGAINPALLFGTYMSGAGEGEAEALAKERYKGMVGAGRGVAPPSPRSQVGRR